MKFEVEKTYERLVGGFIFHMNHLESWYKLLKEVLGLEKKIHISEAHFLIQIICNICEQYVAFLSFFLKNPKYPGCGFMRYSKKYHNEEILILNYILLIGGIQLVWLR